MAFPLESSRVKNESESGKGVEEVFQKVDRRFTHGALVWMILLNVNGVQGDGLPANGPPAHPEQDGSCRRLGKNQPGRLGGHCP